MSQCDFELVTERIDAVDLGVGGAPVTGRVDVATPGHHHPVEPVEKQRNLVRIPRGDEDRDSSRPPDNGRVVRSQGMSRVTPGRGVQGSQARGDADQRGHLHPGG